MCFHAMRGPYSTECCGCYARDRRGATCPSSSVRGKRAGGCSTRGTRTGSLPKFFIACKQRSLQPARSATNCGASTARRCGRRDVPPAAEKELPAGASRPRPRPFPQKVFDENPHGLEKPNKLGRLCNLHLAGFENACRWLVLKCTVTARNFRPPLAAHQNSSACPRAWWPPSLDARGDHRPPRAARAAIRSASRSIEIPGIRSTCPPASCRVNDSLATADVMTAGTNLGAGEAGFTSPSRWRIVRRQK